MFYSRLLAICALRLEDRKELCPPEFCVPPGLHD